MRVLLPLKNASKSNLDNSESNSVSNEQGDEVNNRSGGEEELIVIQQNLKVGETLAVPLKNVYIAADHRQENHQEQPRQQPEHQQSQHPQQSQFDSTVVRLEAEGKEGVTNSIVDHDETTSLASVVLKSEENQEPNQVTLVINNFQERTEEVASTSSKSVFHTTSSKQQHHQRRLRKRPIATTSRVTASVHNASFPLATVVEVTSSGSPCSTSVALGHSGSPSYSNKRSKLDSKPAAKVLDGSTGNTANDNRNSTTSSNNKQSCTPQQPSSKSQSCGSSNAMTVGGGSRRRFDSHEDYDENNDPWISNNSRVHALAGSRHRQHGAVQLLLTPAENEPPSFHNQSHPVTTTAFIASTSSSTGVARMPHPQQQDKSCSFRTASPCSSEIVNASISDDRGSDVDLFTLFHKAVKKLGFEIVEQEGDGNCLFRAVSLQVYGDADHHPEVRDRCMDFMASNAEHYGNFVAADDCDDEHAGESFSEYIARKRNLGVHGNHAEIQAISELYNRPIEVYTPDDLIKRQTGSSINNESPDLSLKPMNIFHTDYKTSDVPIRLSYHDGNHYNAIIDPLVPTAGLGLGLPGLQPGLADKMQLAAAVTESDQLADQMELERLLKESANEHKRRAAEVESDDLQRALKESVYTMDFMYEKKAMVLSDLDATNFELEQEALAESLDSYGRQEHGRKQRASPVQAATCSNGRRRCAASDSLLPSVAESSSSVAAIPPAAAAVASVASAPTASSSSYSDTYDDINTEYPQTVQELVMNGFELKRVVRAYELVGDNFDDLLAFLISTSSSTAAP